MMSLRGQAVPASKRRLSHSPLSLRCPLPLFVAGVDLSPIRDKDNPSVISSNAIVRETVREVPPHHSQSL
jgi:hypothetical protein